ncbi:hypothetical protein DM860_018061 [Cuscuta australis]|uniref:cytokinin riboside 5'-monophosphate phosphoribohydrolase n=1 Tax=Cuscuta australis TaxID=267555 RepID=A0A328DEK2_9ASTE|nr:hypothetical protein DM860_018061 [Cuscuta australis]
MEGTSRALSNTIRFVGLLGSHALGSNPRFMATAVDLGRELVRRKIRLTYEGGNVGLQGAVASTVYNNGGRVRGFIPGYIATRGVYGPTYGAEYTVSSNYYKYFEMNHIVEAFIVLPGGIDTIEGLFTLISWASEGLYSRPIGLLNIDSYFNNLIKFLDDAVRQNFMASNQRKLFISSFFVDELLDKLEFAKAFPGPGASYEEFANPGRTPLRYEIRPFGTTNSRGLSLTNEGHCRDCASSSTKDTPIGMIQQAWKFSPSPSYIRLPKLNHFFTISQNISSYSVALSEENAVVLSIWCEVVGVKRYHCRKFRRKISKNLH